MKFIISRYNHDMEWLKEYPGDHVIYDRSDNGQLFTLPYPTIIAPVQNIGSDIYDKLTFIINNYDCLPEVAIYTKANLFKYISKEEFDLVKDNKTFTPLHTKNHKTKMPVAFYSDDGMYNEVNNRWFLNGVPTKYVEKYDELIGNKFKSQKYKPFSPGSNYILPKKNIQKHPKHFYETLRFFLSHDRYPGEAFLIERDMYNIFK